MVDERNDSTGTKPARHWGFGLIQTLVGQTALVGAALYSFGVSVSNGYWSTFGLNPIYRPDESTLSILLAGSYFLLLAALTIGLLAMLAVAALAAASSKNRFRQIAPAGVGAAIGVAGFPFLTREPAVTSLMLAVGGTLMAVSIMTRITWLTREGSAKPERQTKVRDLRILLVFAVSVSVAMAWGTNVELAAKLGQWQGNRDGQDTSRWPTVVLYSKDDLRIALPGVTVTDLGGTSGLRYRYAGLKELTANSNYYLFVSPTWRNGDPIEIIRNDDAVRLEFVSNRSNKVGAP